MKKTMLIGILFLSIIFLVSCSKSPQEKIVGEWINDEEGIGYLITAGGNVKEIKDREVTGNEGTWELNDEEPLVLKILEDGELLIALNTTFINDDEVNLKEKKGKKYFLKEKSNNKTLTPPPKGIGFKQEPHIRGVFCL